MHLPVKTRNFTFSIYHGNGIMINSLCSFLKKGSNDNDVMFFCRSTEYFRRWAGNGFCKIKIFYVLFLAEISRFKQFREANYLCSFFCCFLNLVNSFLQVL